MARELHQPLSELTGMEVAELLRWGDAVVDLRTAEAKARGGKT